MTAARLVARTVRGIEDVVAREVRRLGPARVVGVGHREVRFDAAPTPAVLDLRTADDVFLVAAEVTGVGRAKADLRSLAEAAAAVPRPLPDLRADCGGPPGAAGLDVSASFLGRRNYTRYDVEDAVGAALAARFRLPYHGRRAGVPPPGGLSWRVTIADDRALIALRIAARPLHRRPWRVHSRPGGLHPPLAAAMVALAAPAPGERLLDPFCGTGTIAIEAATGRGVVVLAGDHDPTAVEAARANAGTRAVGWFTADAGRLPLGDGAVDLVVTNPPWARQVRAAGALAREPRRFWRELRRVLRPGGRALLLVPDADRRAAEAARAGLVCRERRPVRLAGTWAEVVELRA